MSRFNKIINTEKKRFYKLQIPNLFTKYVMILANNSKSISIKPIDITFFCIFTIVGAYYHEIVFSLLQNFYLIILNPLMFIEVYLYPILVSFGLISLYGSLREYDFTFFSTDKFNKK